MHRIWIVGPPCTGKTHLLSALKSLTDACCYELDQLYWKKNWTRPVQSDFVSDIAAIAEKDSWVIDGYYAELQSLLEGQATMIILIEKPLAILCLRLIRRSMSRIILRKRVCGGNTESLKFLLSADGLLTYTKEQYIFFKNDFIVKDRGKLFVVKTQKDLKRLLDRCSLMALTIKDERDDC